MTTTAVGWPVVQKELTATTCQLSSTVTARAYQPIKRPFSLTFECWGSMIDQFFIDIQSTTAKKAKSQPTVGTVGLNFETTQKHFAMYAEAIISGGKVTAQSDQKDKSDGKKSSAAKPEKPSPLRLGLSLTEQIDCIKKAKEIALKWFEEQSKLVINGKKYWMASTSELLDKTWHIDPEMHRFFFRQFKLRSSKDPASFTAADRQAFGFQESQKLVDASKLNCAVFALMKVREPGVKEYLVQEKEFPTEGLKQLLISWKYTPTETPEANDLVLYLDEENKPTHLGRFLSSGQVESKLGIQQPYFHWHHLFDVPMHYGDRVVFWRRPLKTNAAPIQK